MASEVKHVLLFCEVWGNGGVEAILYNLINYLTDNDVKVDLLCFSKKKSVFDNVFCSENVRLINADLEIDGKINALFKKRKIIKTIISGTKYDIIHCNVGRNWNLLPFYGIDKNGSKLIVHSHCDSEEEPNKKIKTIIHQLLKKPISRYVDFGIGCSTNALKWMFTGSMIEENNAITIYAGVDIDKNKFNQTKRVEVREMLGISEDNFVVGHVGRMCYQKNSLFLLSIFNELKLLRPESKMIYIGNGEMRDQIEVFLEENKLKDSVIVIERTDDVAAYMSAMDAFLMPSVFEGLGLVLIEAQVNGLKCYASDTIPTDAAISNNYIKMSIKENPNKWAVQLSQMEPLENSRRTEYYKSFLGSKHDKNVGCLNILDLYYSLK